MFLFFQFNFRRKKEEDLILCASPAHVWPQQTQFMQFVSYYRVIVTVSGVHCHQSITSKLVDTQGNWTAAPSMLLHRTHGSSVPCASQCGYQLTYNLMAVSFISVFNTNPYRILIFKVNPETAHVSFLPFTGAILWRFQGYTLMQKSPRNVIFRRKCYSGLVTLLSMGRRHPNQPMVLFSDTGHIAFMTICTILAPNDFHSSISQKQLAWQMRLFHVKNQCHSAKFACESLKSDIVLWCQRFCPSAVRTLSEKWEHDEQSLVFLQFFANKTIFKVYKQWNDLVQYHIRIYFICQKTVFPWFMDFLKSQCTMGKNNYSGRTLGYQQYKGNTLRIKM